MSREELIAENQDIVEGQIDYFLKVNPKLFWLRDDMRSEALLRLVQVVDLYLAGSVENFGGYLRQSVRRAIIDVIRSERSIQKPRAANASRVFVDLRNTAASENSRGGVRPTREQLDRLGLSPAQEEVFLLRLQGLSYSVIAELLGISEKAVGDRAFRAKQKCQKLLK